MQPLISVIVPVYNGQDYLGKCIESIEAQTYENLEIIIINDGSTDNTGTVCVRLKERFENIRVITTEDVGVSAARNAGIDAAKGVFITFVDADDRLRPKTLAALYDCIMETGSDVAGCSFFSWQEEEEWEDFLNNKYRIEKPVKYSSGDYLKDEILKGNSRCWSKLYRRGAVGKLRFKEGLTIGEDMLFLITLLPYVRGIAETAYPGYGYFQNPGGAMKRKFTSGYMDQITCWELAREEVRKLDSELNSQVTSILIMGILLTVGKLAALSAGERRKQKQYVRICHEKLKEESRIPGACERLSRGYQIKVKLFLYVPGLYLRLYHLKSR
ncbi:MAG: glycosyltransferase [Lachnospiraceae bacterium]|nr:glycosyltransferase [Lachnospiraceae bacterium]